MSRRTNISLLTLYCYLYTGLVSYIYDQNRLTAFSERVYPDSFVAQNLTFRFQSFYHVFRVRN